MYAKGDVADQRILLLGDDDLLSIALALTGLPREIVVVEIDPRLCEFHPHMWRATRHLNVHVIQHDAREKLPADLRAHFDTFVTDPSETIQGFCSLSKKGWRCSHRAAARAGYFGVTLIEASMLKWNVWERHLLQNHALVFTHISEPFSLYGTGMATKDPSFLRKGRACQQRSERREWAGAARKLIFRRCGPAACAVVSLVLFSRRNAQRICAARRLRFQPAR